MAKPLRPAPDSPSRPSVYGMSPQANKSDIWKGTGPGSVHCVFWPDGKKLASSSADQTIRTWDVASQKCLDVLRGHRQEVWRLALLPDDKTLVSGAKDGTVCFWDTSLTHPRLTHHAAGTNHGCLAIFPGQPVHSDVNGQARSAVDRDGFSGKGNVAGLRAGRNQQRALADVALSRNGPFVGCLDQRRRPGLGRVAARPAIPI